MNRDEIEILHKIEVRSVMPSWFATLLLINCCSIKKRLGQMILQMCSEQKGFDLVSRKAEFEVIKSEDLELPLSDSPPMNFDTVVENGLLDIASEVSKAFKSNQDMETSLRDDIVLMHNLFDDYHPKDSLRPDNFIITGNL